MSLLLILLLSAHAVEITPFTAPRQVEARTRLVIRTEKEWADFWSGLPQKTSCPRAEKPKPLPVPDFSKHLALVAAMGRQGSTGPRISIGRALREGDHTDENGAFLGKGAYEVVVTASYPPPGSLGGMMMTCPTAVVLLPKHDGPVRFVERTETRSASEPPKIAAVTGKEGVKLQAKLRSHPDFQRIVEAADARVMGTAASRTGQKLTATARLLVPSPTGHCRLRVQAVEERGKKLELRELRQLERLPEVQRQFVIMSERFLPGLYSQAKTQKVGCDLWPQGDRVRIDLFWPAPEKEVDFTMPAGAKFYKLQSTDADPRVVPAAK